MSHRHFRFVLALVWIAFSMGLAQETRNLHIASWPAHAEVFVDRLPEPGYGPVMQTPCTYAVPADSDWVRIHLFRPGYADTAIDVRVPSRTDNWIMVHLQPETDRERLESQGEFLAARGRHRWGLRLAWGALIPVATAGVLAWRAESYYDDARASAADLANSSLANEATRARYDQNYRQAVHNGNRYRGYSAWSLAGAGLLLATGFVLTF